MKPTINVLDDARQILKPCTLLASCAALAMATGCAALGTRGGNPQARIYPGVQRDVQLITHPKSVNTARVPGVELLDGISVLYGIGDLGPSTVVDTLWLPFDLVSGRTGPALKPVQATTTTNPLASNKPLAKSE